MILTDLHYMAQESFTKARDSVYRSLGHQRRRLAARITAQYSTTRT
jgi:hypothetical protein